VSSIEDWEKLSAKEVKGRSLDWHTPEGITVKPLYTADDVSADPGLPGFAPSRAACGPACMPGAHGRSANMRAFPRQRNRTPSIAAIWRRGKGLSVAFDLATHRGYDSDHPRVVGDVGKAGVAIDSVEDMKILFDGIPLGEMSVSMTMNGAVIPILAFFIVAGEEQGCPERRWTGPFRTTF
jgi:methylmalonyl-CoA mutase